jgi:hypothetical protein
MVEPPVLGVIRHEHRYAVEEQQRLGLLKKVGP